MAERALFWGSVGLSLLCGGVLIYGALHNFPAGALIAIALSLIVSLDGVIKMYLATYGGG